MQNLSGSVIKGYELRDLIGEGGFGAVYRAYQPLIRREVAVKIILPQYANRAEFIRRFETEAQLVARLEHPFIVPLYDYWREPSGAYLVMRWLRGGSLQQALEKDGPWEPLRVSRMLNQIAEALAVAHRQGVIHRDLKLDNILLDENGNAFLSDFGIAKDLGGKDRITQNNAILGSPAYLSPEQIKGEDVTAQSDIYSLGILLFELLTGQQPFSNVTPAALLYKHLSDPLPDLATLRPDLPLALNAVIQRATAKDPTARYIDSIALAADFRQAVKSEMDDLSGSGTAIIPATAIIMPDPENPYKGLRAFQQADAADFFGRAKLVERLLDRMNEADEFASFLAVVGPSGSGKSSVVKAGVIPALQKGALIGSDDWFIVEMVPGIDPMEELEAALLRIAVNPPASLLTQLNEDARGLVRAVKRVLPDDNAELLIVIDQFEELFTLVENETQRNHFMESLINAISEPRSRVRIILTMRADFYDRPLQYVRFGELIRRRTEIVLPLSTEELEQAITGPAVRVGITLEPGLVTAIVTDVNEQPGALPLLQYALTELFERRDGATLTMRAYQDIGGTLGALAQRADELYDGLGDEGQEAARQLFLRLVTLGEGAEDTRRRAHVAELLSIGQDSDTMSMVIDAFGRYRLLTFDHDPTNRSSTVEVAHEALIRQWGLLREWLAASREDLRQQRRLSSAAEEWLSSRRDPSYLARGVRLEQFEEWQAGTTLSLNKTEADYLAASIAEREKGLAEERARQEREEALEKRSRNRMQALLGVVSVAAVIAITLAVLAFTQGQRAQAARAEAEVSATEAVEARAEAERSAAQANGLALAANARNALNENNNTLALSLAVEADRAFQPAPIEVMRVLASAAFGPGPRYRLQGSEMAAPDAALSPDGRYSAAASISGVVTVWDNTTGEIAFTVERPELNFTGIRFSPDSQTFITSGTDNNLYLWSVEDGSEIRRFEGHTDQTSSVVFSTDGTQALSGSLDRTLRLWDVATGETIRVFEGHVGTVLDVALSPDGRYAASSSGDAFLRNDGEDERDRTIRIWDVASGEQLYAFTPTGGYMRTVTFSPDSHYALSGTWSGATSGYLSLWDLETGEEARRFYGHSDIITGVAFTPDGSRILSTSWDRTLRVWSVTTGIELNRFDLFDERLLNVAVSTDGQYALVPSGFYGGNEYSRETEESADTSVWLIDLRSRAEVRTLTGSEDWLWSMDISSDGTLAASGSGPLNGEVRDASVRIWDITTGDVVHRMEGHTNTVEGVEFSPDDAYVLSASWDGNVILWDAATGEQIRRFGAGERTHEGRATNVAFSPDGQIAASCDSEGLIILWDVATGEEIGRLEGHEDEIGNIAFSPDGAALASASYDQTVRLWDVATGQEIRRFGPDGIAHDDDANDVVFSPDGTQLLSSAWDGSIRLWNVETGNLIRRFDGHNGFVFGLSFSPDGQVFLSASSDTTVRLWDIATGQELRRLDGHTDWVSEVEFTPDGTQALSSGQDNVLRLWQVPRTAEDVVNWARENRYLREVTCAEREQYRIEPLCQ
ncbi:MAG: protein kinase [bacterium]|nr:protein kinase [bacterium]